MGPRTEVKETDAHPLVENPRGSFPCGWSCRCSSQSHQDPALAVFQTPIGPVSGRALGPDLYLVQALSQAPFLLV